MSIKSEKANVSQLTDYIILDNDISEEALLPLRVHKYGFNVVIN